MSEPTKIVLVNENDEIIGAAEKLLVHEEGLLHRAFSILVFNQKKELLIHQRAWEKYHSGGLWTNTCCGHPNENEEMKAAVHRRLQEEMGFDCPLEMRFKFQYRAEFKNGLIENEIDHVYVGGYNGTFNTNPEEVADYKWINVHFLLADVARYPNKYTYWFREILKNEDFLKLKL